MMSTVEGDFVSHTQLFLKQSCEQKKLSLMPSFRHVGHCRLPASFSQSTPRHFFLVGGSDVMTAGVEGTRYSRTSWWEEERKVAY
jgi:hypothetical protein